MNKLILIFDEDNDARFVSKSEANPFNDLLKDIKVGENIDILYDNNITEGVYTFYLKEISFVSINKLRGALNNYPIKIYHFNYIESTNGEIDVDNIMFIKEWERLIWRQITKGRNWRELLFTVDIKN